MLLGHIFLFVAIWMIMMPVMFVWSSDYPGHTTFIGGSLLVAIYVFLMVELMVLGVEALLL